jgi:hypothetical protein
MTKKSSSAASGEWENPYMPTPMCGVAGIAATMIAGKHLIDQDHSVASYLLRSHDYMTEKRAASELPLQ